MRLSSRKTRALLLAIIGGSSTAGAGACHSSSTASDIPDATTFDAAPSVPAFTDEAMRAAISAYNTKYCEAFKRCDPVAFEAIVGTDDNCLASPISQLATNFTLLQGDAGLASQFAAYGARMTPDALMLCASKLDLSTCDEWVAYNYEVVAPPECDAVLFGTLPDDSPCAAWNQCAGGRCYGVGGVDFNGCGRCAHPAALDTSCGFNNSCPPSSGCWPQSVASSACTPFAGEGEPCDVTRPCHFDLICSRADGSAQGTCVSPPPNGACDPTVGALVVPFVGHVHGVGPPFGYAGCSAVPSFRYCNPATNTCDPLPLADLDAPCGPAVGAAPFTLCKFGLTCTLLPSARIDAGSFVDAGATTDASGADADSEGGSALDAGSVDAQPQYVCRPLAELGAACSLTDQPFDSQKCKAGVCYLGKCQENGPAQCSAPVSAP